MIAHSPELATTGDDKRRMTLLMEAQQVLPEERQRPRGTLWTCTVYKPEFTKNAMAKALAQAAKLPQTPTPSTLPDADKTAPGKSRVSANDERPPVHWSQEEYIRLAHDDEVRPLLDKGRRPSTTALLEAVIHAQARMFPSSRWRPRAALAQSAYRKTSSLLDKLREAMRFPPIHVPTPDLTVPDVAVQGTGVVLGRPNEFAGVPVEHLPASGPEPAKGIGASTLPQTLTNALDGLLQANTNMLLAFMDQMRHDVRATLEHVVDAAMKMQNEGIRANVRATIEELLGDRPTTHEPPKPDFRADMKSHETAAAMAEAAVAKAKRRVDVIGLLNGQAEIVRKACGTSFDLRFIGSNDVTRTGITAPTAIVVTKFVGHDTHDRIRKFNAKMVYANGGPESVIKALQELA